MQCKMKSGPLRLNTPTLHKIEKQTTTHHSLEKSILWIDVQFEKQGHKMTSLIEMLDNAFLNCTNEI